MQLDREKALLYKRTTRLGTLVEPHKTPNTQATSAHFQSLPVRPTGPPAPLSKQQHRQQHPVLHYMVTEMKTNAESDVVKGIRALNASDALDDATAEYGAAGGSLWSGAKLLVAGAADSTAQATAQTMWAWLVFDGRLRPGKETTFAAWDYKPRILDEGWGCSQLIDFSPLLKSEQIRFYYSIWGNIHYGYVGRAAGFTEDKLVEAADQEHVVSSRVSLRSDAPIGNPLSDTTSFKIGFALYAQGKELTELALLKKLYEHRGELHRYDPNHFPDHTYYAR